MDINLTDIWLRKDPARWIAGVMAGLLAGAAALLVAGILSSGPYSDFWFPAKLMATTVLGPEATEIGSHMSAVVVGIVVFELICAFFGVLFAHFTGTNLMAALLPMGVVWGIFSWIFVWNLFLQSSRSIFAAQIPSSGVFPVCIVYGLTLASVAFFDRMFRGSKR